jgi:hypothetical protein
MFYSITSRRISNAHHVNYWFSGAPHFTMQGTSGFQQKEKENDNRLLTVCVLQFS